MRVSVIEGDQDYYPPPVRVYVYLDGQRVTHVRWADDEAGELERCVLDADGHIQVNPDKPDEVWTEVLKGRVRIDWWHHEDRQALGIAD